MPIIDSARKFGVSACIDCGKCSWGCPVSHKASEFSPRWVVENFLDTGHVPMDKGLWDCMTCGMCSQLCTSGVSFHEFIREARPSIRRSIPPETTHSDILHIIQNLSSLDYIKPRTNNWMTSDLELDERSSTLLFVGCTPYYDVIFRHLRNDLLEIPRSSTRLLNSLGIRPRASLNKNGAAGMMLTGSEMRRDSGSLPKSMWMRSREPVSKGSWFSAPNAMSL